MLETLDDATTAYILDTRRPFEELRQVASQLAGLLVLAASGARSAAPAHAMLPAAREMFTRAADEIRGARPSARSRQHHGHLLRAVAAFDHAFCAASVHLFTRRSCGEGGRADRAAAVDVVLTPLKAGYEQLQEAADGLPGFELVAFKQGCCFTGQVGQVGQVGQAGQVGQVGQAGLVGQVGQVGQAGLVGQVGS